MQGTNLGVFVVLTLCLFGGTHSARCPSPGPVARHFLDASYFSQWYVLRAGSNYDDTIPFTSCLKWEFSYDPVTDPFVANVTQTGNLNGTAFGEQGFATISFPTIPSHLEIFIGHSYYPTDVVATDVTQYAIHWMCRDNDGFGDAEYTFQVLSRTTSLNPLLMADIEAYIEGLGMRGSDFVNIDQTNCN